LQKAILHRKNSLFYKTLNGARVGDLFMSLIHTCELNGANPFEYLAELQRHAEELKRSPSEWMPWNYRETLARLTTPRPRNRMNSNLAEKDSLWPLSIITRKRSQNGLLKTPARKGLWPSTQTRKNVPRRLLRWLPGRWEETVADIVELAKTMLLHRKSSCIRKKMNGLDALQTLHLVSGFWV
jgi:hypothetical protein